MMVIWGDYQMRGISDKGLKWNGDKNVSYKVGRKGVKCKARRKDMERGNWGTQKREGWETSRRRREKEGWLECEKVVHIWVGGRVRAGWGYWLYFIPAGTSDYWLFWLFCYWFIIVTCTKIYWKALFVWDQVKSCYTLVQRNHMQGQREKYQHAEFGVAAL